MNNKKLTYKFCKRVKKYSKFLLNHDKFKKTDIYKEKKGDDCYENGLRKYYTSDFFDISAYIIEIEMRFITEDYSSRVMQKDNIWTSNTLEILLRSLFYSKLGFNEKELPSKNMIGFLHYLMGKNIINSGTEKKLEDKNGEIYTRINLPTKHTGEWQRHRIHTTAWEKEYNYAHISIILTERGIDLADESWILYSLKNNAYVQGAIVLLGGFVSIASIIGSFMN